MATTINTTRKLTTYQTRVLAALAQGADNATEIRDALGEDGADPSARRRCYQALAALENRGLVVTRKEAKNRRTRLTEDGLLRSCQALARLVLAD